MQYEQSAHRTILAQLAAFVADALGEGWTLEPSDLEHRVDRIAGPDGASLILGLDWRNADRLEITGAYPGAWGELPYGVKGHQITAARSKDPQRIAADITRRLLPVYLPDLERVRKHLEQRDYADHTAAARADAFESRGCRVAAHLTSKGTRTLTTPGKTYGRITVSGHSDSVSLEVGGITLDQALRIADILNEPAR